MKWKHVLFAGAGLAAAQQLPLANINPSQASAIVSDLSAYLTSATAQAEFSSFLSAFSSALGPSGLASLTSGSAFPAAVTATPTWFSKIPGSIVDYATSLYGEMEAIVASDLGVQAATGSVGGESSAAATATDSQDAAARPTKAPVLLGAGMAMAGVVAGAVLIL